MLHEYICPVRPGEFCRTSSGRARSYLSRRRERQLAAALLFLISSGKFLHGREGNLRRDYGQGFSIEISAPESIVEQAVEAVVNDGIIQGSKEYKKDQFIDGAMAETSSSLFSDSAEKGKIYYKVRDKILAPLNFKASQDEGTVAVRYIVESEGETKTVLRINAIFEEAFRHTLHPSDGSVEAAEYRDVQDRIDAIELENKKAEEDKQRRQEQLAERELQGEKQAAVAAMAEPPSTTPEERVENLRRQVERVVIPAGAPLKSAPFHSATSLASLAGGSTVVILIETPYWSGIETESGQRGWLHHSQLEPLP